MLQDMSRVGPGQSGDGAEVPARAGKTLEQIVNDAHGRYYEISSRGNLFVAHAIVTAPVIYTTAAGTGGPIIWVPPGNKAISLVGMSVVATTAATVAGELGITGGPGQVAAPTSTTVIDARGCLRTDGGASSATPYRVGTPVAAGTFFLGVAAVGTNATTAQGAQWYDLAGLVYAPPGTWVAVAGSATLSTLVAQISLVYEEVPYLP